MSEVERNVLDDILHRVTKIEHYLYNDEDTGQARS